jgi:ubiquinone/menaquinone biosynthesis C-methylase UbiE
MRAGKTLEVGCGTGKSSEVLRLSRAGMFHLDINRRYLEQARQRRVDNLVLGDGCCLPFRSSCLDQVLVVDAFHHIFNLGGLFAEVHRVLRRGGRFIVFDPVFKKRAENAWVCDIGDGPIWKHTIYAFHEKIGKLASGRFKELAFEESHHLSVLNTVFGTTDALCVLEKK